MSRLSVGFRRVVVYLVAASLSLLVSGPLREANAQPMAPSSGQPAPLLPAGYASQVLSTEWRAAFPYRSAFGSLCSLGPLACALIDRPFAFNAHLELIIRPKAPDGSTGVLLPFAVSVPLFGRAEVGLGSCYAGWWASKEDADKANADPQIKRPGGLCPFWLAAKLLVFPWFRDPHTNPALAVEYQFEYQAGPFDGLNQLGLPGPLSKVSLAYRHPLGNLELAAAVSVLVDHTTHAGTLQFGPHIGYRLPVGEHFWIFGQAVVQAPSWGPTIPGEASGQTLNLAPPVSGSLAVGVQQRADFGIGAGLTLMMTKSEIDTRVDLLFRVLSFEVGPHIKPLIPARDRSEAPPKVTAAVTPAPMTVGVCPPGMQPAPAPQGQADVQADANPGLPSAAPSCISVPPPPLHKRLPGTPCYLYDVDGTQQLRMGFVDSTGDWCDWDGLHLPLGAVVPPARHEPPPMQPSAGSQQEPTPGPGAALPVASSKSGTPRASATKAAPKTPTVQSTISAAEPTQARPSAPARSTGNVPPVQQLRANSQSSFEQGFIDGAEEAGRHARQIYQAVKEHGPLVVLPGPQDVKEWWRDKKEECLNRLGACIRDEANQAREELNRWSQMSWDQRKYEAGRLAFDAVVEISVNSVLPGGGVAAGTVTKAVEHEAERQIAKTVEKQAADAAARKAAKEAAEHEARRLAEAEAKRVAEAEARRAAEAEARRAAEVASGKGRPGSYAPDRTLPTDKLGVPTPDSPYPHTQLGRSKPKYGAEPQAREWDHGSNGNLQPKRDIDFTDHGTPNIHPNPHQHTLTPNNPALAPQGGFKRGSPEPL